jgi:oligopeptide transport system ATP-binding protein
MSNEIKNDDIILSVCHLKQYFKFDKGADKYNKAVHDVSFDVKRGEVLGLVGESGCGKTTTGRSIIKLYNITSGSVYFNGVRISAGTRWNEKEIKFKTKKAHAEIAKLKEEETYELNHLNTDNSDDVGIADEKAKIHDKYSKKITKIRDELEVIVSRERENIKSAHYDNKNCNKVFAAKQVALVKEKYKTKIEAYKSKSEHTPEEEQAYKELYKNYRDELRIAKNDKIMNKMQMIFQDPIASLDPRMTVREIIAEGLRIRGIRDNKTIDKEVEKSLTEVGLLPEHATRYPHEFSGGQRQRIGIARALIMNPDLIIADEPISALDVSIQAQVINLLNDLKKERNLTILFIAHDLSVVKYFCDRIAVMYFGNLVELATSDELFKHPLHPYTKSLLSAIPLPDPHFEKNRKRIDYVPSRDHNYANEKPELREVEPGHFVRCSTEEFEKYKKICNE